MSLAFARESFETCLPESFPLFEAHWKETEMYRAGRPFAPDLPRYSEFDRIGFYQFFTARDAGELVGNAGMYVTQSMHEAAKTAVEDTWFLKASHRKGRNAINFLKFVEQSLREQQVTEIYMTTKLANGAGRILEFCGYAHIANQYWKEL